MYKTANTLPEEIRSRSVTLLNRHLAAAIDLHAQIKQAHWNVRGPTFIAIHELFDKVPMSSKSTRIRSPNGPARSAAPPRERFRSPRGGRSSSRTGWGWPTRRRISQR